MNRTVTVCRAGRMFTPPPPGFTPAQMANTSSVSRAMAAASPLSHLFSGLFFASIGMIVSPWFLWTHFMAILVTVIQVRREVDGCEADAASSVGAAPPFCRPAVLPASVPPPLTQLRRPHLHTALCLRDVWSPGLG